MYLVPRVGPERVRSRLLHLPFVDPGVGTGVSGVVVGPRPVRCQGHHLDDLLPVSVNVFQGTRLCLPPVSGSRVSGGEGGSTLGHSDGGRIWDVPDESLEGC